MFCPNCGHENNDENKFCMKCGKPFNQQLQSQSAADFAGQNYQYIPVPVDNCIYTKGAKIIRLVVGIISMVLPLIILLQSCASGIINVFENPEAIDGTIGVLLSIFMLTAGIISVAARKTRGGTITAISFYLLGAVISNVDVSIFKDLIVWSFVSLIFAILLIISLTKKKYSANRKKISLDVIVLSIITLLIAFVMLFYGGGDNELKFDNTQTSSISQISEDAVSEVTEDKKSITEEATKVIITEPEPIEENVINSDIDKSIIPGIYLGMSQTEVIDVLGGDFTVERFDESNNYYPPKTDYNYLIYNVDTFNINMPAIMFFEFSETGILFNYGYHIGYDGIDYQYDLNTLNPVYDQIYSQLEKWYGPGKNGYIISSDDSLGLDREYVWETDYGSIWFVVGENMWGVDSGVNEIVLSCSDDSLRY